MHLSELQAQEITLVRVLEQSNGSDGVWSPESARAATRAAIDLVEAGAPFSEFVARRAQWVLDELGNRAPEASVTLRPPKWPRQIANAAFGVALVCGFMTDLLASGLLNPGHINVVELPLVMLILWNVTFLTWFSLKWIGGIFRCRHPLTGTRSEQLGRWLATHSISPRSRRQAPWVDAFNQEWGAISAQLNNVRFKAILSMASALFTFGALCHLMYRASFQHYTAGWTTTLTSVVSAEVIHRIVSVLLAPGAALMSRQIPDAQHIETLRMPPSPGELAENWIWLYFGSVIVWVIIPRLYVVGLNRFAMWRMHRKFPLPLDSTYFTALRAARTGERIAVSVIPFRYELTAAGRTALEAMLNRIYGPSVNITIDRPVLMGQDPGDWKRTVNPQGHVAVLVLCNLATTAESDIHGSLLTALRKSIEKGTPIVPIVDTSTYPTSNPERVQQRKQQWRQALDKLRFAPLFLDLTAQSEEDRLALNKRLNHVR